MDAFTFTPHGVETLEAFNLRLKKYCVDHDVVGVVSSLLGSTLVLSLTLATDGIFAPFILQPIVMMIPTEYEPALETALTQAINDTKKLDNPEGDVMSVPIEVRAITAPSPGHLGYALMLVAVGEMDDGAE